MEKLDYATEPRKKRLPSWFKITGGFAVVPVIVAVAAIAIVIFVLWLCIWVMGKVAPAL